MLRVNSDGAAIILFDVIKLLGNLSKILIISE